MGKQAGLRLHKIDAVIRDGHYPSAQALAERLEVSSRTVMRDLEYLRDQWGAPLDFDRQRAGYYYKEPSWALPNVMLTERELFALLIAENAIRQYAGMPFEKGLRSAFRKITERLSDSAPIQFDHAAEAYSFRFTAPRPVEAAILQSLTEALHQRKRLKMVYYSAGRDATMERTVDPYHLDNQRGDWYLIAYDHLRQGLRHFAVNRIRSCRTLPARFTLPEDFDYQAYMRDAFGIVRTDEPVEVALEFRDYEARLVRERIWHESQRLEERPDGSVVVHLRVSGLVEVKRWILSAGRHATVLEPDWLAEEMRQEHEAAASAYKQSRIKPLTPSTITS